MSEETSIARRPLTAEEAQVMSDLHQYLINSLTGTFSELSSLRNIIVDDLLRPFAMLSSTVSNSIKSAMLPLLDLTYSENLDVQDMRAEVSHIVASPKRLTWEQYLAIVSFIIALLGFAKSCLPDPQLRELQTTLTQLVSLGEKEIELLQSPQNHQALDDTTQPGELNQNSDDA